MTDRHWIELTAQLAAGDVEQALARLAAAGFEQCWLTHPLVNRRGDDGWDTRPGDVSVLHLTLDPAGAAAGRAAVRAALAGLTDDVQVGELRAEEWLRTWREGRRVVALRDGWSIAPPWLAADAPDQQRVIVIDPGLAFGAGDHPTTRDSAVVLLELLHPGDRVLDLGAGSGVLSILAVRAGAATATAVESDELAAGEIDRNTTLNQVDQVEVIAGDAQTVELAGPYDLLLCNIGARLAQALAPRLESLAAPGSRVVLSGLTEWTSATVAAAYAGLGWRCARRVQRGSEWVTLGLVRRNHGSARRAAR